MRWVLVLLMAACGERAAHHDVPEGHAELGGDVISTVDGHPIDLDSVASLASRADLSPAAALERRQAEELLALEAYRRGYGEHDEPKLRERQRLVQALLDRIAAQVSLDSISEADVEAHFARRRPALTQPEQRAIRHMVVQVEPDADEDRWGDAERLALRLRGEWATDPSAYARYLDVESLESFPLHVEASGSIPSGSLEAALDEVVFGASEPGVLPGAHRSSGGWHVLELVRIERPEPPELAAFADAMRNEIAVERRHAILLEHVDEASERFEVHVDEVVATRALALELQR